MIRPSKEELDQLLRPDEKKRHWAGFRSTLIEEERQLAILVAIHEGIRIFPNDARASVVRSSPGRCTITVSGSLHPIFNFMIIRNAVTPEVLLDSKHRPEGSQDWFVCFDYPEWIADRLMALADARVAENEHQSEGAQ